MNNKRFELFRLRVQFRTVTGVPSCVVIAVEWQVCVPQVLEATFSN